MSYRELEKEGNRPTAHLFSAYQVRARKDKKGHKTKSQNCRKMELCNANAEYEKDAKIIGKGYKCCHKPYSNKVVVYSPFLLNFRVN
jgi:hypothetical protein